MLLAVKLILPQQKYQIKVPVNHHYHRTESAESYIIWKWHKYRNRVAFHHFTDTILGSANDDILLPCMKFGSMCSRRGRDEMGVSSIAFS